MSMKNSLKTKEIILNIITIIIVIACLFPLIWLLQTSTKNPVDAFAMPPKFIFFPTLENFKAIIFSGVFIKSYGNSLVISSLSTIISILLGLTSGYALARAKFKASKFMGLWIILTRMAPPIIFILPLFLIFQRLHLLDTYFALILTYQTITLPFATWMLTSFFRGVPEELEEAAMIDGCTRIKTIFLIDVPIIMPGIVTCAIFSFIMSWNEFFYALILSGIHTKPISVLVQGFVSFQGINWGQLTAAGVLVTFPVLIISFVFQRGLVKGLVGGAIK